MERLGYPIFFPRWFVGTGGLCSRDHGPEGMFDVSVATRNLICFVDICRIYIGYIPTPLTVNKMVCFYFYHPGGAPRFS